MKIIFLSTFLILVNFQIFSQTTDRQKGKMYLYWGWNDDAYTKSNLNLYGKDYNFTLHNIVAHDKQNKFGVDPYFRLDKVTIPQYNARIGYFISDNWDISLGVDHMKYVMQPNQVVKIDGYIHNSSTNFDGDYANQDFVVSPDFLQFEHTDGLNYLNLELRRFDQIADWGKVKLNLTEGFSAGLLMPKTNATLLNNERHDDFNLAGFGLGVVGGLNLNLFKYFFIQSELKGGFINMPNIRTTQFNTDHAKQHFFFGQVNIVFGGIFRISN